MVQIAGLDKIGWHCDVVTSANSAINDYFVVPIYQAINENYYHFYLFLFSASGYFQMVDTGTR